jgi:TPP-dependent pyruvate/acetoin dehydrogenase alpha subunit
VTAQVDDATEYAEQAPDPSPDDLFPHVFAKEVD